MREFNSQEIIVKLVDGSTLKGRVRMKSNTRLSDQINADPDPFIVLFDIAHRSELGNVLFINKAQIIWVSPIQ